jgi:hypothetical protein
MTEYHPCWGHRAGDRRFDEDADEAPSPPDEDFLAAVVARL